MHPVGLSTWIRAGLLTLALLGSAIPSQAAFVSVSDARFNGGADPLDITFSVQVPVQGEFYDKFLATSVSVSVLDADGDGDAMVESIAGFPIFRASVDGVTKVDLLEDPIAISCDVAGCIATLSVGPLAGALTPDVIQSGIAIGISYRLSPGDSATVLGRFEVVPEPATALLLVGGLAAMAGRRRTR